MAIRRRLNAAVDLLSLLSFVPVAVSGGILFFVFSNGGFQGGRNPLYQDAFLGLSRNDWIAVHDYGGMAFIVLMGVHIALHWRYFWHINRYLGRAKEREPGGAE
ncbi:MAG TPA: DUF4405 domain-containing protein [Methanoculleus sp.]|nr:DUF4405 domain-containing protein [Methanoculleus sp.]